MNELAMRTGVISIEAIARVDMAVEELCMVIEERQHIGAIPELWIELICKNWMLDCERYDYFRTAMVLAWNALCDRRRLNS